MVPKCFLTHNECIWEIKMIQREIQRKVNVLRWVIHKCKWDRWWQIRSRKMGITSKSIFNIIKMYNNKLYEYWNTIFTSYTNICMTRLRWKMWQNCDFKALHFTSLMTAIHQCHYLKSLSINKAGSKHCYRKTNKTMVLHTLKNERIAVVIYVQACT